MTLTARAPTPELDRIRSLFEEHAIHTVELATVDLHGTMRGKRLSAAHFLATASKGISLSSAMFVWGRQAEIPDDSPPLSNWDNGFPDFQIVADLGTVRACPWRQGTAIALGDAYMNGAPVAWAPRALLAGAVDDAQQLGCSPRLAFEMEFYLLDPATLAPGAETVPCYSLHEGSELEPTMAAIRLGLERFGIEVEASNAEYAPGQFEINLRYGEALASADDALLTRYAVKQIAAEHGMVATFMAKPFTEHSGSGMHLHQSLLDERGGALFWSADEAGLSERGRAYVAGLLSAMPAFTVLGSSTPNAYKRRVDFSFSAVNASWGTDNRTVAVRTIADTPSSARVEQRDAAADANPYLVAAGQLRAGLHGLRSGSRPPSMTEGNAYATDSPRLPATLDEALAGFRTSRLARELLGGELVDLYAFALGKEAELARTQVADWERARYLVTS